MKYFQTNVKLGELYFPDFCEVHKKVLFKDFMTDARSEEDLYYFRASILLLNRSSYGLFLPSCDLCRSLVTTRADFVHRSDPRFADCYIGHELFTRTMVRQRG